MRHQVEVGYDVQSIHLLSRRGLHVDIRIDSACRRRIGLAVRAERDQGKLILHLMHCLVILGRAGAVNTTDYPHHARRRFVLGDAIGQRSAPSRSCNGVLLRLGAGSALARHLEHVGPSIKHRHQVITSVRVRDAEDVRLFGESKKADE